MKLLGSVLRYCVLLSLSLSPSYSEQEDNTPEIVDPPAAPHPTAERWSSDPRYSLYAPVHELFDDRSCTAGPVATELPIRTGHYEKVTSLPLLLHIAKTGGGTFQHSTDPKVALYTYPTRRQRPNRFGVKCTEGMQPPKFIPEFPEQNVTTFCVVRHPFSRLVSAYQWDNKIWRVVEDEEEAQRLRSMRKAEANAFLKNFVLPYEIPDIRNKMNDYFRSFILAARQAQQKADIRGFMDTTANQSLASLADEFGPMPSLCKLQPQTDYIWGRHGERTCDYVLRFEHLEREFSMLGDFFEAATRKEDGTSKLWDATEPQKISKKPLSEADLADDVKAGLFEIFYSDFCRLGYDPMLPDAAPLLDLHGHAPPTQHWD